MNANYIFHTMTDEEFRAKKFGLPKVKKFPMPDAAHVKSAIKFFNYAKPSQEKELANAILARMDEYGIDPSSINVGDDNRFKRYFEQSYLKHHGILGMKWGVRRFQNKDGSRTSQGKVRYSKLSKEDQELVDRVREHTSKYKNHADRLYKMEEDENVLDSISRDSSRNPLYKKAIDLSYTAYGTKQYKDACIAWSRDHADKVSSTMLKRYGRKNCNEYADFQEWPKGNTFEDRCRKTYYTDDI